MSGYGADANPFSDPGPNPFSHNNDSAFSLDGVGSGSTPAPAPSGGIANMKAYVADHDSRAAELERKQRELEERERQLNQRETELAAHKSNWPFFAPILVHDIKLVPQDHQRNAGLMYKYWLVLLVTLIVNFLACLFDFFGSGSISSVGASAGYLIFISILSFVLWYYPIYTGWCRINKRGAAILFYMYFIFGAFHILYSLYMAIGGPSTGSAGLIVTIKMLIDGGVWNIIGGVLGVIASLGWIMQCVGGMVLYKLIWNFKNHNAEINWANAKTEFTGLRALFRLFRRSQT